MIKSKVETKVSLILAHYNREDLVLDTLNSIKNQTFHDFECLIMDDCSTDSSPELLKNFCLNDSRFKYYRSDKNSRKYTSYNRGIKLAQSDYLIFIDNDDIFDNNYIAELYNAITANNSDMAVCNYNIWHCDTDEIIQPKLHGDAVNGGLRRKDDYIKKTWYLMFPPQVWTKIFRKDIIVDNDIRFVDVAREGNLFIHKYQYYCENIYVVDKYLVNYRLFSDINKHSSGGDYYDRTDVLYEMIGFKKKISEQKQIEAWNKYLTKFIYDIYTYRRNRVHTEERDFTADEKVEFGDIINLARIEPESLPRGMLEDIGWHKTAVKIRSFSQLKTKLRSLLRV